MESKSTLVSVFILILVLAAGLYWSYGSNNLGGTQQTETPPTAINPATGANIDKSKTYREIVPLKPITGNTGSGQAQRIFDGSSYSIELFAGGLDSSKGKYQAWLYTDDLKDPIFLGEMSKVESGNFKGSLTAKYTAQKDLKSHNLVVVTMEKDKLLEGRFAK